MVLVRGLAVVFLTLAPALAVADAPEIPKMFLGEWNADLAQCGEHTEESSLYIEPHRVTFWESSGPVRAAVVRERELALILELSGEGEVWLSATQFELSPDGNALIWKTTSGEKLVRFRCPGAKERPNNSSKPTPLRGAA